jgi:hypothetical protein
LESLEQEKKGWSRKGCRFFRLSSIFLVPTVYLLLFGFLTTYLAKADLELNRSDPGLYQQFDDISIVLFKVLGYWTTITNITSCVILGLVIQFVRKITRQPIESRVSI